MVGVVIAEPGGSGAGLGALVHARADAVKRLVYDAHAVHLMASHRDLDVRRTCAGHRMDSSSAAHTRIRSRSILQWSYAGH